MLDLDCPPFEPHPWLRGPHAQTLATRLPRRSLVRRAPLDEARAIRVDSTSEVLALCRWQAERRRAPLALLLHGLTGDASADYMLGVAEKLTLAGFSTARMNMRGCGGTEALARSIYHAGLTEDVATVARELREREQIERVYLVGCSLGGGMMLRWLGELGASVPDWLRGAAVVSPAIDLAASQRRLDSDPRCRMYREFFLSGLKEQLRSRACVHAGLLDVSGLARVRTLLEFDNRYTGPLSRYGSAERYYGEASALPVVDAIRRPTLVIAAQDDPFIPFDSFRDARFQENAWLQLLAPANGGHVAFIAERAAAHRAWCDVDRHWAENRVAQFLHHLEEGARRSYHRSA
jgi:predicted alpha/beta-fold hydrolase